MADISADTNARLDLHQALQRRPSPAYRAVFGRFENVAYPIRMSRRPEKSNDSGRDAPHKIVVRTP
jgi:hypothetical protein